MPRKGWKKGLNLTPNTTTQLHGNGSSVTFEDVLRYFRGKSPDMREQGIEAIRAMGALSKYPGRPALAKELNPDA